MSNINNPKAIKNWHESKHCHLVGWFSLTWSHLNTGNTTHRQRRSHFNVSFLQQLFHLWFIVGRLATSDVLQKIISYSWGNCVSRHAHYYLTTTLRGHSNCQQNQKKCFKVLIWQNKDFRKSIFDIHIRRHTNIFDAVLLNSSPV